MRRSIDEERVEWNNVEEYRLRKGVANIAEEYRWKKGEGEQYGGI
jgi:hypothetical protein